MRLYFETSIVIASLCVAWVVSFLFCFRLFFLLLLLMLSTFSRTVTHVLSVPLPPLSTFHAKLHTPLPQHSLCCLAFVAPKHTPHTPFCLV